LTRAGRLQRFDHLQLLLTGALSGLGLMTLFSASGVAFHRQLVFLVLGLGAYAAAASFDYRKLQKAAPALYGACLLLLLAVTVAGHVRLGAQRWISLAGVPVEPSELGKLLMLVVLAAFLSSRRRLGNREILASFGLGLPPVLLVLFQPDLGTSIVFLCLLLGMLFLAGASRLHLAAIVAGAAIAFPVLLRLLHGYQRQRLQVFLDPSKDPLGAGYNLIQARIAVGSGGLFGQGWLHGHQGSLGYVPERTTDFVFAVYAEQFGLVGCVLLLAVFTALVIRLARSAAVASDRFGHLLCAGMAVILGTQVVQNVGMNIGATPIAGIPLPLISHGGSATVAFLAGLGLVQSVMLGRRAVLHQESRPLDSYLLGESGTVRLPM
jgi:rod shape determining protein RodA